jgi:hypothetical protein
LLYTSVSQKDILAKRNLLAAVFGDAMADTTPYTASSKSM